MMVRRVVLLFLCALPTLGHFAFLDRRAEAQAVIATDDIEKALADKRPAQMSVAEIEAQRMVKAVLTDVIEIATVNSSVKIQVGRSVQKDYVPAVDLAVYFDFDSAEITSK